jgi:hypothetical protein
MNHQGMQDPAQFRTGQAQLCAKNIDRRRYDHIYGNADERLLTTHSSPTIGYLHAKKGNAILETTR